MTLPFHCPIQPQEHLLGWLSRIHLLFGHIYVGHSLEYLNVANKPFKANHHNESFADAINFYKREVSDDTSGFDEHSSLAIWALSYGHDFYSDWRLNGKKRLRPAYLKGFYAFETNWKYCSECVKEDIARCGHSYWHVEHQLPSITHCSKHKTPLIEDTLILKDLRNGLLPQAYDLKPMELEDNQALLDWSEFVVGVYRLLKRFPTAGAELAAQIRWILSLPQELTRKDDELFFPLQNDFDASIGPAVLRHLFFTYRESDNRTFNVLQSTLGYKYMGSKYGYCAHPVCWLIILYWLKGEISWGKYQ